MGSDKALALFHGVPLIQVALQIINAAGVSARIAGARSDLSSFAAQIPDTFTETGPLGGIHAALTVSDAEWNLFLPVDLPLMPSSLLTCLFRRATLTSAPVTAARLNGRIEPFPVILHCSVLPSITQRLLESNSACYAAWQEIPLELDSSLDAAPVEYLHQCGQCSHPRGLPPALWFQSANTPAELLLLNRLGA
jgi:molybdopterin-guanine dinucleotide biosynthesis protein A